MWYDDGWQIFLGGGEIGAKHKKKLAQYKNFAVFQQVYMSKVLDALSRYSIKGLPETISERVVLQSLLWYGGVCFFEKEGALFGLPGVPSGEGFNINGDPGSCWVFGRNGKLNEEVKLYIPGAEDSRILTDTSGVRMGGQPRGVMVWENQMRFPFIRIVMYYSQQIADTLRSLEVSRRWIKKPFITFCEESMVPTVEAYLRKIDDNEDAVIGTGIYDPTKVKIEQLQFSPSTLESCTQLIEWYESKFRELCGIDSNSQIDKKGENLIRAELAINDDYTALAVDKCIPVIEEGLDLVNLMMGTHITVEKRAKVEQEVSDNGNEDIPNTDK